MSKFYVVVSVESESLESVSTALNGFFGGSFEIETSKACLGIYFDIEDRSEEYEYASNFIADEGLEEDFNHPKDIDVSKFGVEIDLYTSTDSIGYKFIDVIGDSIAIKLSSLFKNKVMLRVGDSRGPLFIYDKGVRVHEYVDDYAVFFSARSWYPTLEGV